MKYRRKEATHPNPNLTQEQALEALYRNPNFVEGTKILSIKKANGKWKADLMEPRVAAGFPPGKDPVGEAEESAHPEDDDDGPSSPPPERNKDKSDSGSSDSGSSDDKPESDDDSDDDDDTDSQIGPPKPPKDDAGADSNGKGDEGDLKEVVHLLHQLVQQLGGGPAGGPPGGPPGGHEVPPPEGGPPGGPPGPPPPPGGGPPPPGGGPPPPGKGAGGGGGAGAGAIRPEQLKPGHGQVPLQAVAPSFSSNGSVRVGSQQWGQLVGRKKYFQITSDPTRIAPKEAAANIQREWNPYGYELTKLQYDEQNQRYHAIVSHRQ